MAGPVEAAALGNVLVQARAGGVLDGGLTELRALLRQTQDVRLYLPTPGAEAAWAGGRDSEWRPARRRPGAAATPGRASRTGPAARRWRRGTAARALTAAVLGTPTATSPVDIASFDRAEPAGVGAADPTAAPVR